MGRPVVIDRLLEPFAAPTRAAARGALLAVTVAGLALGVGACSSSDSSSAKPAAKSTTTTAPRPAASTVSGLLALGRPIVLAHAGGDNTSPHDTPYGFNTSAALGVDALDMDVQLSSDGVLVVQHDATVDRTTEATGAVASMTYDQLHALDAGYWFTDTCTCKDQPESAYLYRGVRTGAKPPPKGAAADDFAITSFEQIARRHPDFVLNVEIKGTAPAALPAAAELARLTESLHLEDRLVVTSFDDVVAEAYHAAAPRVQITPGLSASTAYVLSGALPPAGQTILQLPPSYESIEVVTPAMVAKAHADGLVLWVWPNEDEWETAAGYNKLLDMGVDGLNAADPATAVQVVRSRG